MKMRCVAALCAIAFALAAFVGCSQKDPGKTADPRVYDGSLLENENPADNYYLSVVSGQYYLHYTKERSNILNDLGSLSFGSLDELIDKIRNNRFEEREHNVIRTAFRRDENGVLLFDLDHPFYPVLPSGVQTTGVEWAGQGYSYSLSAVSGDRSFGYLHVLPRQSYLATFQREYEALFDRPQITVTARTRTEDRNAEIVLFSTSSADQQRIRYTLPNGVIVDEQYVLKSYTSLLKASALIPQMIHLYYESERCCFTVSIFGLTERPSVEWLSRFGLSER